MGNRDDLIAQVNDSFQDLVAAVQDLTDDQMTKVWFGEWGIRDVLAHVAGWHWEMSKALERIARGERPVPEGVSYDDADTWNAKFAGRASAKAGGEVMEDLRASQEAFVAAAMTVPEDRFAEGRAAARILETTGFGHYAEHLSAIREWREQEGI
jgi:hypothetical protein